VTYDFGGNAVAHYEARCAFYLLNLRSALSALLRGEKKFDAGIDLRLARKGWFFTFFDFLPKK